MDTDVTDESFTFGCISGHGLAMKAAGACANVMR